ncbi:MAG: hypothetical protein HY748_03685 [Elusimicrobia bacterium]|nr:hypothetical protein [Elusimicrobiota bacterium]
MTISVLMLGLALGAACLPAGAQPLDDAWREARSLCSAGRPPGDAGRPSSASAPPLALSSPYLDIGFPCADQGLPDPAKPMLITLYGETHQGCRRCDETRKRLNSEAERGQIAFAREGMVYANARAKGSVVYGIEDSPSRHVGRVFKVLHGMAALERGRNPYEIGSVQRDVMVSVYFFLMDFHEDPLLADATARLLELDPRSDVERDLRGLMEAIMAGGSEKGAAKVLEGYHKAGQFVTTNARPFADFMRRFLLVLIEAIETPRFQPPEGLVDLGPLKRLAGDPAAGADAFERLLPSYIVDWRDADFSRNVATVACEHYSSGKGLAVLVGSAHLPGTRGWLDSMLKRSGGRLKMTLESVDLTRN